MVVFHRFQYKMVSHDWDNLAMNGITYQKKCRSPRYFSLANLKKTTAEIEKWKSEHWHFEKQSMTIRWSEGSDLELGVFIFPIDSLWTMGSWLELLTISPPSNRWFPVLRGINIHSSRLRNNGAVWPRLFTKVASHDQPPGVLMMFMDYLDKDPYVHSRVVWCV